MTSVETAFSNRTSLIRQAARSTFQDALNQLDPARQHAIMRDIMQLEGLLKERQQGNCRRFTQSKLMDRSSPD